MTKNKDLTDNFIAQDKQFLNILNKLCKTQKDYKYKSLTKDKFIERIKKIESELNNPETKIDNRVWLLEKTKKLIGS